MLRCKHLNLCMTLVLFMAFNIWCDNFLLSATLYVSIPLVLPLFLFLSQTSYSDMERWHSRSSCWREVPVTAWLWLGDWYLCNRVRQSHTRRNKYQNVYFHVTGVVPPRDTFTMYLLPGKVQVVYICLAFKINL